MLAKRGVDVSHETVRRWFPKFSPAIAANLRRLRPRPSDHWHLDEMVVRINGKKHWLWRAGDHDGEELDVLVQARRSAKAAKRLLEKQLRKMGFAPRRVETDRLRTYPVAFRSLSLNAVHDRELRDDNRAENSHRPIRRRERKQQDFKSPGSAKRFLSVHVATHNTSFDQRHLRNRSNNEQLRPGSFDAWAIASVAA